MQYRNLAAEMTRAGITSTELAQLAEMNPTSLSLKMNKKYEWKLKEMEKIQDIINKKLNQNYSLDYLFEEYEEGAQFDYKKSGNSTDAQRNVFNNK